MRLVDAFAALTFGLLVLSAAHDVSQAWDSGYYHLPFAARLWGILPEDLYVFSRANEARFQGFPLLAEWVQGALWRASGRVQGANFVGLMSLVAFCAVLARSFGVRPSVAWLGLLGVPLVQTHATSAYVDLPANLALALGILFTVRAGSEATPRARDGAIAMTCLAFAGNAKLQLLPMVGIAAAFVCFRFLRKAPRHLAWLAPMALVGCATVLRNAMRFGNPVYPVALHIGPMVLHGPEAAYASSPPALASWPAPVRWALSVFEVGRAPWSVDQFAAPESLDYRMGGFFGLYVLLHLVLLARRAREPSMRPWSIAFALLTAVASVMPQSHELRYYMAWMVVLVSTNLIAYREYAFRLGMLGAVATGIVVVVTGGAYVMPSGSDLATLRARKVDAAVVERLVRGKGSCVDAAPFTWLYAAPFQGGPRYVVREAEEGEPCPSP